MLTVAAFLSLLQDAPSAQEDKAEENKIRIFLALRRMIDAQITFKTEDLDGNAVNDYWVGDISGLYRITPPGKAGPIRMIDEEVAKADIAPLAESKLLGQPLTDKPAPYLGYWFKVVPNRQTGKDSIEKYDQGGGVNADRFAVCAIPADQSKTRRTYIVSESGLVFAKDTGGKPVDCFPMAPGEDGWKWPEAKAIRKSPDDLTCRSQLEGIREIVTAYRVMFGGPQYRLPDKTGSAYFTEIKKVLEHDDDGSAWFKCPSGGRRRGPAKDVNDAMKSSDTMIVCEHSDGALHVLDIGFRCLEIGKKDEEAYRRALEATTDR
jgi:hypothetical protein